MWIALEGVDAAGKTTQVSAVGQKFRRRGIERVVEVSEFSESSLGTMIRQTLIKKPFFSLSDKTTPVADMLCLLADMTYRFEKTIKPAVIRGEIVISDRSPASFIVYQLTQPESINLRRDPAEIENLSNVAAGMMGQIGVISDLCVLITLTETEMVKRIVGRGMTEPNKTELNFLRDVEAKLERIVGLTSREIKIVNGNQSVDGVTSAIFNFCLEKLNRP